MNEQDMAATAAPEGPFTGLDQVRQEILSAVDEKLDIEAVAQLVEHLDFGQKLNGRLQNAFGELRRHTTAHCSDISAIKSEIRELIMDVALLKRALTSLGHVGVMERRKIQRELILELLPPGRVRQGTGVVTASPRRQAAAVECESRLPLCKAACCRIFNIHLTPQEVEQAQYEWNPRLPYTVQKNRLGCMYLAPGGCSCSIYGARPVVCSNYSCAKDRRIWADYEKKELNPELKKRLEALDVRTGTRAADGTPPTRATATEPSFPMEAVHDGNGHGDAARQVAPPDFSALREMIIPEPQRKFVPPKIETHALGSEHGTAADCSDDRADAGRTGAVDTLASDDAADMACCQERTQGEEVVQSFE